MYRLVSTYPPAALSGPQLRFRVPRRAEELVVGIRAQLDALLRQKIANPALELSAAGDEVLAAVKALLESAPPLLC